GSPAFALWSAAFTPGSLSKSPTASAFSRAAAPAARPAVVASTVMSSRPPPLTLPARQRRSLIDRALHGWVEEEFEGAVRLSAKRNAEAGRHRSRASLRSPGRRNGCEDDYRG